MDADLVVLAADPASDPRNFDKVAMSIRAGKIINRKHSSQLPRPQPAEGAARE